MFNPDEIHKRFDELFKSAGKLNRGQYSHYESFTETCNKLDRDRDLILRRAIDLCSLTDTHFDDIDFDDMTLNALWCSIKPTIRVSIKKWASGKSGGDAKASKSKSKAKSKSTKQPTKTKKNTEIAKEKSAVKDLTKSECVSLICLSISVDSDLALEIYQYRVLKKVMNTKRALDTFFFEINKAIDISKKPVQDVLNYYLSSSWKSFEASWFLKSVEKGTESNQEVNALNAVGFEHLADFQKENMIINREKFRKERGYYDENKGIEQGNE
jgi:hypothetical protein